MGQETPPPGNSTEWVSKVYDLSGLLAPALQGVDHNIARVLPIRGAGIDLQAVWVGQADNGDVVAQFLELFEHLYASELKGLDHYLVNRQNLTCGARLTEDLHAEFVELLEFHERLIGAHCEFQVDVIEGLAAGATWPTLASMEEAEEWLLGARNEGTKRQTHVVRVPLGGSGFFQNQTKKSFVTGLPVYQAEATAVVRRKTEEFRKGAFGLLMAKPRGAGLQVDVAWLVSGGVTAEPYHGTSQTVVTGDKGEPHRMPLGGQLDLTRQAASCAVSSARMMPGQSLFLGATGEGGRSGTVVVVRITKMPKLVLSYSKSQPVSFALEALHLSQGTQAGLTVPFDVDVRDGDDQGSGPYAEDMHLQNAKVYAWEGQDPLFEHLRYPAHRNG